MGLSRRAAFAVHATLIVLAAIGVSGRTLGHGFVFDDHLIVEGNLDLMQGDAPLWSAFGRRYWGASQEPSSNELYRPVTILSIALSAKATGNAPAAQHAVNVALHAANALLVFGLVALLFARSPLALLAGLVFAVHPIATEAVAPLSGRADLLAAFFVLASAAFTTAASRRRGPAGVILVFGSAAAALLGALSKENAFVVPALSAVVLLSNPPPRRESGDRPRRGRLAAVIVGTQIVALAGALLMRHQALGYVYRNEPLPDDTASYISFVNNPIQFAPLAPRALTALRVAVKGAGLLVFPYTLSADYSYDAIPVSSSRPGLVEVGGIVFVIGYLAVLFGPARRSPPVFLGLVWLAVTYLPVSNLLFPMGTIFGERLLYLPSAGAGVLFAAGVTWIAGTTPRRRVAAWALSVVVVSLFAARFVTRCGDWAGDASLFRAAVAASPRSAKAHHDYALTLQRTGRFEEAAGEYRRALEIAPRLTYTRISLAQCLTRSGRFEEAVAALEEERRSHPDLPVLRVELSRTHFMLGARSLESGRNVAFLEEMRTAVAFDPGNGPAHYNLAVESLKNGDRDAARAHAEAALRSGYVPPRGFLDAVGLAPPTP